ncbi:hypothetical protein LO771_14510 [Streptacidiphilus sp. ASG 303]|uniref:glycoside hydrolase family 38 N-terminal domain-containing protein n=1 Tax=Streptacidiphilus sp. ASG 303 TaxID=2896847 RepID=UPI001E421515|nr:hypothetical protein [Streptacidiphilus sp. ASG 303]MCD0483572.1 hypothetical protein [Streptacidiphilus sp. ASG 303]
MPSDSRGTVVPQAAPLWTATVAPLPAPWSEEDGLPVAVVDLDRGGTWPARHPGIHDAHGGHRGHRVRVSFTLDEALHEPLHEARSAVLHLEYAADRGPCPDLEIVLDGRHRGVFHPPVERRDRSRTGEPGPVAGHGVLRVPLPAAWLGPGRHDLTVTTVCDEAAATGAAPTDDPDAALRPGEELPPARSHYGHWFGSYLTWRAARLETADAPGPADAPEPSVRWELRATPFHLHGETPGAEPVPLVELTATVPAGAEPPGPLVLRHGDREIAVPAAGRGRDFGMLRHRLPAPGFTAGTLFTLHDATVHAASGAELHRAVLAPARRWTLHLVPHVHLDLGFTDTQAKAVELHCRNIDRALDRLAHDPGFRFCVDGSFVAEEYLRTRSPRRGEEFLAAVAAGRIGVNAFHSNLLTGVTGLDDLRRALRSGTALPAAPGPLARYANITDVPVLTGVLPAVLRAAGVDAFVGMANHHRAATDGSDELHLASPVRWRAADGSEVLAHFADHYSQLRFIAADPQAVAGAVDGLDRYLRRYERPDYLPRDLALIGTHADNEDLADGDTSFAGRWNAAFAWPRVRVSTFLEYLQAVEPLRERLPVHTAEGGSYWEDGVAASAAAAAAHRGAQALLPAAEELAAALALADDRHRPDRRALDRAWDGLLIGGEHTWTWARATTHPHAPHTGDQLHWKLRAIDDAARLALDETRRCLSALADTLGLDGPGVLLYNPHPWPAAPAAELDLPAAGRLLDAYGGQVPVEVLADCAGMTRVRLVPGELPAHGWRFLPLTETADVVPAGEEASRPGGTADTPGPDTPAPDTPAPDTPAAGLLHEHTPVRPLAPGAEAVTAVWRLRTDPSTGLPAELWHLPTGRQLLDPAAPHPLGLPVQLLAAGAGRGGPHGRERILQLDSRYHPGATDLAERPAELRLLGARAVPDGLRLRWAGRGAGLSELVVELLLRDAGSCELTVDLVKEAVLDMESLSVAFPFLVERPVLRYDRQLGWVEPARDHGPGACNEWLVPVSAVTVTAPDGPGVVWAAPDTPLVSAGDLVRGGWPERFTDRDGRLYACVTNNFWPCNTPPVQPGPARFRFVFAPVAAHDPAAASRFGALARLGALTGEVTPLDRFTAGRPPRYAEGTVLDLRAAPHCRVSLARTAEDRMRVQVVNLLPEPVRTTVPLPAGWVAEDTAMDTAGDTPAAPDGAVPVALAPYGLADLDLRRIC